ncbi:MAG: putative efflux pump [Firmicutes bacterium]|nr:putative efflux pump [Bacillota bacterium]
MHSENKKPYNVTAIMIVLLFGGFISLFNETILNVALPKLMTEMHVAATTVQWLATGYMLIVAISVSISAFLLHTFTTKQLYLGAMTLLLLGTVLAVFSNSFPVLLLARMVQATGTGLLIPIMINTVLIINPREKHGFVMGICTCVIILGPTLGPIVSGALLQFFNWQALFILLVPLILICMAGGALFLKNVFEITKPKIDYLSVLLSIIGLTSIIYGISVLGSNLSTLNILLIFTLGIIALILFSTRQLTLEHPLLDIRAFKHPYFALGAILVIVMQMVQFSMNMLLPMLLQEGLNVTSFISAMVLFPASIVSSLMNTISGKIYDKFGGKTLIPLGLLITCGFLALLSRIQPATSIITIAILNCFIYLGISLAWSPAQTNALKQLSMKAQADGVAILNLFIQIGAAIGTPLFIGLMAAGQNNYLYNLPNTNNLENQIPALYSGFNYSLLIATGIIAIAFLLSLSFRRKTKPQALQESLSCAEK